MGLLIYQPLGSFIYVYVAVDRLARPVFRTYFQVETGVFGETVDLPMSKANAWCYGRLMALFSRSFFFDGNVRYDRGNIS